MASGTLVPFMSEVGLPGDSFDIDLDCDVPGGGEYAIPEQERIDTIIEQSNGSFE